MLKLLFISYTVLITVNRKHFVQAQTSILPLNAAANVGDRVVINCTTNFSVIPRWSYSQTGIGPFTPISYAGSCTSEIPSTFVVESTGNASCNLIIPSATTAEALAYQCDDGRAFAHSMLLTIIESVQVSPNSTTEEPCPGDPLNITCSVKYSAVSTPNLRMFPSIMWTNSSANDNISGTNLESPNVGLITSYLSIVVPPSTVPPYSCNVYFNAPAPPKGFATNAPNYYNSTYTAQLEGCNKLDASSINVTSYYESGICEAKILDCRPNAYPPPHDVHWLDVHRNEFVNGTRITAEFGGEYICSVTNAIKTVGVTYKLNDDSSFTMDKCKGVSEVNITESEIYKIEAPNKISLQSNANMYSCGNDTENITATLITCTTNGLPNSTFVWYDQCHNPISTNQQTIVTTSGPYTCVANNSINGRPFKSNSTKEIRQQTEEISTVPPSDDCGECLLLLILLLLVFLVPPCVFLPCYGCSKSCRENVNKEFPWIEKALPCMNGKGCECSGGMVLFIFCLVICGIVFVPWILIASHCCQKNAKKSQGDSISLRERNGSNKESRQQSGASHQSMSSSMGAPTQSPPPHPPIDPYHSSHAPGSYPHSRPPPNSRATNSPSPVSASGVEYGELRIDVKPGSRKPVELIVQKESNYAELHTS